jgi:hypothetical protein
LAALAGWAVAAAAQTTTPGETPPATRTTDQIQERAETQNPEAANVQKQGTSGASPTPQRFVDADGDGICDNFQGQGRGAGRGSSARRGGRGPGDGTGRQGVGPRDGSGYGAGARAGNCDGTGPKGRGNRGGRR